LDRNEPTQLETHKNTTYRHTQPDSTPITPYWVKMWRYGFSHYMSKKRRGQLKNDRNDIR